MPTLLTFNADGSVSAQKPLTFYAPISTLTNNYPDVSGLPPNLAALGELIKSVFEWDVTREGRPSKTVETFIKTPQFTSVRGNAGVDEWGFDVTVNRDGSWQVKYKGLYSTDRYGQPTLKEPPNETNNPFPSPQVTTAQSTQTVEPPQITVPVLLGEIGTAIATNPGVPVQNQLGVPTDTLVKAALASVPEPFKAAAAAINPDTILQVHPDAPAETVIRADSSSAAVTALIKPVTDATFERSNPVQSEPQAVANGSGDQLLDVPSMQQRVKNNLPYLIGGAVALGILLLMLRK